MANEVNINITAHNLTGPGFASATASAVTFGNVVTNITNKFSGTAAAAKAVSKSMSDTNSMIEKGTRVGGLLGGVVQALTSHVKLFGGALDQIGLPKMLSMVSGWHLLTEAVIETAAVWAPAAIAVTAFGLAATPVVIDLGKQMQSLQMASEAVNKAVYPLKGTFSQVSDAVKPQVYQLFGEALVFMAHSGGTFQTMATGVGKALDDLGARFVAATTNGKGVSKFAEQSVSDFKLLGDAIGNFGGIIGNVFKAVPGYAEILLKVGDGVLHVVEGFTNAAEPVLAFGMAAHGALIYLGLLGTLIAKLAMSGFGTLESLAMKAALGLMNFGAAGAKAGGALASFSGMMGRAAALPWGWIGIGVGAIVALGIAINSTKNEAQQFNDTIQKTLQDTNLNNLTTTLAASQAATTAKLTQTTNQLSTAVKTNTQVFAGRAGQLNSNGAAIQRLASDSEDYRRGLAQLAGQASLVNSRVAELSKQYGGNKNALALLNAAGITSGQILDKNDAKWAQAKVEIQATADAMKATTQSAGRLGAAQNALNFEAADTANKLGEDQDVIQKFTKAQDDLLNALIGSEQGFTGFNQALQQMGVDAGISNGYLKLNLYTQKITGQQMVIGAKSIGGLNDASLKLAGDYYGTVIPAAQKLIDSLEVQKISTGDLTKVVATEAASLLKFAGNNTAARVAVVDLINNALGPNTVSLQNLRGWVDKNSTSMQGMRAIIDKTTISASKLGGTIQQDLSNMFAQALIKTTGADKALTQYTKDIVNNQTSTAKGQSDRQKLIKDLENTGMGAQQAARYVDGLSKSVHNLPSSKTVKVLLQPGGSGEIVITGSGTASGQGNVRFTSQAAGGGLMPGYAPGQDSEAAYLSPGEFVLVPEAARALGYGWLNYVNNLHKKGRGSHFGGGARYAGGGLAGEVNSVAWWDNDLGAKGVAADVQAALDAAKKSVQKASQAASSGAGPVSGDAAAAQKYAFGRFGQYGWGSNQKSPLVALWNQESGWNRFAMNPSSKAYGIPQALPYTKMPKPAWPASAGGSSSMAAQVNWGEDYIFGRYVNPAGAWAHEVANNWYGGGGPVFDGGGWLRPGWNKVFNGTGGMEHLMPTGFGAGAIQLEISAAGQSEFEAFMLKMMQKFVRVKGGGDVQKAFGGRK